MGIQPPQFPQGLTFDDVLLLPGHTDFTRSDIDISTKISKNVSLALPLVSSPMDTVTDANLAIGLAKLGGIGIIHRSFSIAEQVRQVQKVKAKNLVVGAAIGTLDGFEERVDALSKTGADVIVVDSA